MEPANFGLGKQIELNGPGNLNATFEPEGVSATSTQANEKLSEEQMQAFNKLLQETQDLSGSNTVVID